MSDANQSLRVLAILADADHEAQLPRASKATHTTGLQDGQPWTQYRDGSVRWSAPEPRGPGCSGMTMETTLNALDWQQSSWTQQFRDRTGFAVQVFPIDTPTDPARHLVAAARLAEEL